MKRTKLIFAGIYYIISACLSPDATYVEAEETQSAKTSVADVAQTARELQAAAIDLLAKLEEFEACFSYHFAEMHDHPEACYSAEKPCFSDVCLCADKLAKERGKNSEAYSKFAELIWNCFDKAMEFKDKIQKIKKKIEPLLDDYPILEKKYVQIQLLESVRGFNDIIAEILSLNTKDLIEETEVYFKQDDIDNKGDFSGEYSKLQACAEKCKASILEEYHKLHECIEKFATAAAKAMPESLSKEQWSISDLSDYLEKFEGYRKAIATALELPERQTLGDLIAKANEEPFPNLLLNYSDVIVPHDMTTKEQADKAKSEIWQDFSKNVVRINQIYTDKDNKIEEYYISTGTIIDTGIKGLEGRVVLTDLHCVFGAGERHSPRTAVFSNWKDEHRMVNCNPGDLGMFEIPSTPGQNVHISVTSDPGGQEFLELVNNVKECKEPTYKAKRVYASIDDMAILILKDAIEGAEGIEMQEFQPVDILGGPVDILGGLWDGNKRCRDCPNPEYSIPDDRRDYVVGYGFTGLKAGFPLCVNIYDKEINSNLKKLSPLGWNRKKLVDISYDHNHDYQKSNSKAGGGFSGSLCVSRDDNGNGKIRWVGLFGGFVPNAKKVADFIKDVKKRENEASAIDTSTTDVTTPQTQTHPDVSASGSAPVDKNVHNT